MLVSLELCTDLSHSRGRDVKTPYIKIELFRLTGRELTFKRLVSSNFKLI